MYCFGKQMFSLWKFVSFKLKEIIELHVFGNLYGAVGEDWVCPKDLYKFFC